MTILLRPFIWAAVLGAVVRLCAPGAAPSPPEAVAAVEPARAVSMVSERLGYGVQTSCGDDACVAVVSRTRDGGNAWTALRSITYTLPEGFDPSVSIHFADARTGWVFGERLWVTRDAGRSWDGARWRGRIVRMASAGGTVWALAGPCSSRDCDLSLYKARVARPRFRRVGAPALGPHAVLFAFSSDEAAILVPGLVPQIHVTRDGGRTWTGRAVR